MFKPVENGYITVSSDGTVNDFDGHKKRGQSGSFGYDLGSPDKDAVIYNCFQGIIVSEGWSNTFGNRVWVKITEGDYAGTYMVYPHMKEIFEDIEDGISINAGRKLGIMGDTGMSQGIHLHLERRTRPDKTGESLEIPEVHQLYKVKGE